MNKNAKIYPDLPDNYPLCLHTDCPMADHCLRQLAFRRHAELLGENANITRFAAAYHLYDWGNYASAASSDLWRIFYRDAGKAPAELPRRTSLERAYAGLLLRGELPGFGAGILPADEIG